MSDILNTILFADDSTFYMTGDKPTELIHRANTELLEFSNWCLANRLTVNIAKNHHILFSNSITTCQPRPHPSILCADIVQVHQIKFPGIIIDKNSFQKTLFKIKFKNIYVELFYSSKWNILLLVKVSYVYIRPIFIHTWFIVTQYDLRLIPVICIN